MIRIRVLRALPVHGGPRIDALHYCAEPGCYAPALGAVQRNGGDVLGRLTWWCAGHLDAAAARIAIETEQGMHG